MKQCEMLGDLPPDQIPAEATRYSTVARQFHMLKAANIRIYQGEEFLTPKGCQGLTRLNEIHAGDTIPPALWHHMRELGITSHEQLIAKTGTHLISTTDMQNQRGNKVKPAHKRTLNRISILLTNTKPLGYEGTPMRYAKTTPLPLSNRQLPKHMHTNPNRGNDINILISKQHTPTENAQNPTTTPEAPTQEPQQKRAKISPTWWNCVTAPTLSQAKAREDTPEKWDAMMTLCVHQRGTAFFKHHKLDKESTGADLKAALYTEDITSPPPPQKVLHMLYSNQYVATHFTSFGLVGLAGGSSTRSGSQISSHDESESEADVSIRLGGSLLSLSVCSLCATAVCVQWLQVLAADSASISLEQMLQIWRSPSSSPDSTAVQLSHMLPGAAVWVCFSIPIHRLHSELV